ncbi:unnamed protein product, partial [Allacma fusca]
SSKTTNLNDTNNSPNSNYIRRPILTTVVDSPTRNKSDNVFTSNDPHPLTTTTSSVTTTPAEPDRKKAEMRGSEPPPKSKLSVSFSNSVQEFDDEDRLSFRNDLKPTTPAVTPDRNGSTNQTTSVATSSPTVKRIIATQVEVHVEDYCANNRNHRKNSIDLTPGPDTGGDKPRLLEPILDGKDSPSLSASDFSNTPKETPTTTPTILRPYALVLSESRVSLLKKDISEVEQQEMEALTE